MIKVLKLGSMGPIVEQWQTFLRGQGLQLDATGLFGPETDAATRAFQRRHRLDIDGKVGNQTFGKAALLGFELVDHTEAEAAFPALPPFPPLVSNAERQALFGPLAFVGAPTRANPEAIRITNGWEAASMVRVPVPQLAGVPGAPASGTLFFHRRGAQALQGFWQALQDQRLLDRVLRFDGAYNPRFVRGGAARQILSNHAFGTAFDLNARHNPLGAEPATAGTAGCVYELVPIAHAFGFYWGGHFSRRDGMHFELARPG